MKIIRKEIYKVIKALCLDTETEMRCSITFISFMFLNKFLY